jgi:DNA repair protein RecO (recombination protein O)
MRAIVLRRTNYGEADRILQLLTPVGKCSVIARGVRREKSRLAGGIELFAICEVVIGEGKGDLGILTSSKLIKFYRHIMDNYDRMQFAYTAIKLVTKSSEMVDGPEWYDVLSETFAGLDSNIISFELVQTWFYLHYSAIMGYELSLWHDNMGNDLSSENIYKYDTTERGLFVYLNGELTSNHIKLLRLISTRSLNVLAKIGGVESVIHDCLLVSREHAAI